MIFKDDDLSITLTDYDKYDYSDLDEATYYDKSNRKVSYKNELKYFHYSYWDNEGNSQCLCTTVDCAYKITHGTFDPTEDSDWDYLGYMDLISWVVLSVENNEGDEVDPEKMLTPEQFLEYTQGLDLFIGS